MATVVDLVLAFEVPGKPQPKQRARKGRDWNGDECWYTPPATCQYEKAIGETARVELMRMHAKGVRWPMTARYRLTVEAYFPDARPRDLDNVVKSVADGLNLSAYVDDRYVVETIARKVERDARPRTVVRLEVVAQPTPPIVPSRGQR